MYVLLFTTVHKINYKKRLHTILHNNISHTIPNQDNYTV